MIRQIVDRVASSIWVFSLLLLAFSFATDSPKALPWVFLTGLIGYFASLYCRESRWNAAAIYIAAFFAFGIFIDPKALSIVKIMLAIGLGFGVYDFLRHKIAAPYAVGHRPGVWDNQRPTLKAILIYLAAQFVSEVLVGITPSFLHR